MTCFFIGNSCKIINSYCFLFVIYCCFHINLATLTRLLIYRINSTNKYVILCIQIIISTYCVSTARYMILQHRYSNFTNMHLKGVNKVNRR